MLGDALLVLLWIAFWYGGEALLCMWAFCATLFIMTAPVAVYFMVKWR
jgi:hypothetical protein